MSFKKHLEEFAANTSMHGFGKIILTKKPEKRAAWLIVFVAAWTLFGYQLYKVVSSYMSYSKKTTTEFIPGGAPFPSITLCNMQSIDFYTLHVLHTMTLDYYASGNEQNISFAEFVGTNNTLAYEIARLEDLISKSVDDVLAAGGITEDEYFKLYSRTTIAANLKQEVLKDGIVRQEEFIVKCMYGNSKCNFKAIDHPYYYRCFTFEPPNLVNRSVEEEFDSLAEGIANGFSVTLFTGTKLIDSKDFQRSLVSGIYERGSPLAGSSGIRMAIHPPGTVPFPLTEGFDVPTGYLASIGIVPQRRERLSEPYGHCDTKNKYHKDYAEQLDLAESDEKRPYRKISCERACMQEHVKKECGCYDPFLPNTGDALCQDGECVLMKNRGKNTGESTITVRNIEFSYMLTCRSVKYLEMEGDNKTGVEMLLEKMRCAENVTNRLMTVVSDLEACGCHPPCDEFHYGASYSLSRWPSMGYESSFVYYDIFTHDEFVKRFSEEKQEVYNQYVKKEGVYALKDFAKVNVYVSDSNVLRTKELPATTLTQLVSDVGGQLGLWIGVSVITISEILETILKIITGAIRKICRRGVVRDGSEETEADKSGDPDQPESV